MPSFVTFIIYTQLIKEKEHVHANINHKRASTFHSSRKLFKQTANTILEQFKERFPHDKPTILHLHETEIPRIEKDQLLRIWDKQASEQTLTAAEEKIAAASSALLAQFKAHHRIVIVSPVHNFNVTSRMKDYIDNIFIARETFKYTENGSVGLMTDDYRVLLLQASGSIFTNNDRYTPLEFSHYYLKKYFKT